MITDSLLGWFAAALVALLDALPTLPGWAGDVLASAPGYIDGLVDNANQWAYLVPWDAAALGVLVAFVGIQIGILVKVVRIVASYVTLGGGM